MHVLMVFMYHPVEKAGIWSGKGRLCYTIHPNSCSTRRKLLHAFASSSDYI